MKKPNIVLIVIDTLRKDYSKILDPVFEKYGFKKYTNVIAPSSWTIPSHASMLTGLYPKDHGAHATKNIKLPNIKLKKIGKLLTFDLKKLGYTNYLFSANPLISPNFGFKFFDHIMIYDTYSSLLRLTSSEILFLYDLKKKISQKIKYYLLIFQKRPKLFFKMFIGKVINPISKFISLKVINNSWPYDKGITSITKEISNTSFSKQSFIMINLMEVHEPYYKPKRFNMNSNFIKINNNFLKEVRKYYKIHINYLKDKLSILLNELKKMEAIIIVTSDHGQLLGEHNFVDHGIFLWKELTYVPLWVFVPKNIKFIKSKKAMEISLVNFKRLIMKIVNKNIFDENLLYVKSAFSETYGFHGDLSRVPNTLYAKRKLKKIDKQRISIAVDNKYAIYNLTDKKFEELDPGINEQRVIKRLIKFYLDD